MCNRASCDFAHKDDGPGWVVFVHDGEACIKFDSKPHGGILQKLRAVATYDPGRRVWRAHPVSLDKLLEIGRGAETWESVGEDDESGPYSRDDYPIFHDY